MLEWVNTFTGWLTHAEVRAILIALVISWNGTQLVKNAPFLAKLPETDRRWMTRAIAFALGFWPGFALWPGPAIEAWAWGIAVGLSSPALYTLLARVAYHYFPWLEPKMSAAPVVKVERQGEAP